MKEDQSILSFTIDKTDTYAALNVMTQGIHLYDINDRSLVRKFRGSTQNTFRIHSCFGGLHHEFVASGSEDNKVCMIGGLLGGCGVVKLKINETYNLFRSTYGI